MLNPAFGVSLLVLLGVESVLFILRRSCAGGAEPDAPGEPAADGNEVPVAGKDGGGDVPVGALQLDEIT